MVLKMLFRCAFLSDVRFSGLGFVVLISSACVPISCSGPFQGFPRADTVCRRGVAISSPSSVDF